MAKKKPAIETTDKPTVKPVAAKKMAKPAAATATKKAAKSPEVSLEEIGHAAGAVWLALDGNPGLTLAALKKTTGLSADLTLAGVGWLAREDKLAFDTSGRSATVILKS